MIDQPLDQALPRTPPPKKRRVGVVVETEGLPQEESRELADGFRESFKSRNKRKYPAPQTYTLTSPSHGLEPDPKRPKRMVTTTPTHQSLRKVSAITLKSHGARPQRVKIGFFASCESPPSLNGGKYRQLMPFLPSYQSKTKKRIIAFPKGEITKSKKEMPHVPERRYSQADIMKRISAGMAAQMPDRKVDWEHEFGHALHWRLHHVGPEITPRDLYAGHKKHNRSTVNRIFNLVAQMSDQESLILYQALKLRENPADPGYYTCVGDKLTQKVSFVADPNDPPYTKAVKFVSHVFGPQVFRGTKGFKDLILALVDPTKKDLVTLDDKKEDDKENADPNADFDSENVRNDSSPSH